MSLNLSLATSVTATREARMFDTYSELHGSPSFPKSTVGGFKTI